MENTSVKTQTLSKIRRVLNRIKSQLRHLTLLNANYLASSSSKFWTTVVLDSLTLAAPSGQRGLLWDCPTGRVCGDQRSQHGQYLRLVPSPKAGEKMAVRVVL